MSTTTEERVPEILSEETLVDTDIHINPPLDEIANYLDEPYRSTITDPGYGAPLPRPTWDLNRGGKIESAEISSFDDINEFVADFSIDIPIVNSLRPYYANISSPDLAAALLPAYNDWMLDRLDDHPEIRVLAGLDPQNPAATAEEIDRVGSENQIVGGLMMNTGPTPPLGDPAYDVLYRALADNGLPIVFHAAAASNFKYEFPRHDKSLRQFLPAHVLTHVWCHTLTLTSLIVEGTPVKFPELDFVFLEAGIGWVPYMMHRLNKEYSIRKTEAPLLEKSPEEYIRDQFYFASQPIGEPNDPDDLKAIIDLVGIDSVLFASDYPHWDFDSPEAVDSHLRRNFSEHDRNLVLSENATGVFDLSE